MMGLYSWIRPITELEFEHAWSLVEKVTGEALVLSLDQRQMVDRQDINTANCDFAASWQPPAAVRRWSCLPSHTRQPPLVLILLNS
ncbi:hypothetical protein P3S68_007427 [Capsicum galapagoense]